MNQKLINLFFQNSMKPQNEILQGLVLKAVCLRHKGLDAQAMLSEDEADELAYLQEALNYAKIGYTFNYYGRLELKTLD